MRARAAAVAVGLLAACGARTGLLAPSDAGAPSIAEAGMDAPIDAPPHGDACTTHCSADLHQVLDCHDQVVETCADDEGCDGSGCSSACLAAQANQTTIGCEYYAIDPDSIAGGDQQGGCFAAFVANTWTTAVTIGVDRDGYVFDPTTFARIPSGTGQSLTYAPLPSGVLQPGEVAILFLARNSGIACPQGITPAITSIDPAVHGTGRGHAFHLTSTAPVAAYQIFPYGGGASAITAASLLLPTTPFANDFVAVVAYEKSAGQPSIAIVATQDATDVTIRPTSAIAGGGGVPGTAAGVPATYSLQAGEELQITQDESLSGSVIQATRPIAVWGGSSCMNIDVGDHYCDLGNQQLPPVRALGSEYVGVRYRKRYDDAPEEIVPWRFVGVVDGTTLTFDPPVPGAPATLQRGQLAQLWATGPFVVRSQDDAHPFYLSAHMTSSGNVYAGGDSGRGDPEFVNVVPTRQLLASYTFFTDPTYPETNLVVARHGGDDVTLDCAGALSGWQPIGASGWEFTRVDLVRHDFVPQGNCNNGRHVMTSTSPFALTVWGWGSEETAMFTSNVSYAYPAGASLGAINNVVVSP